MFTLIIYIHSLYICPAFHSLHEESQSSSAARPDSESRHCHHLHIKRPQIARSQTQSLHPHIHRIENVNPVSLVVTHRTGFGWDFLIAQPPLRAQPEEPEVSRRPQEWCNQLHPQLSPFILTPHSIQCLNPQPL